MPEVENENATAPATPVVADAETVTPGKQPGSASRSVWMGTAVGVGSAALVAALLYAKRRT